MNKKNNTKSQSRRQSTTVNDYLHKIIRRLADSPLPEITFLTTFLLSRWWLNSDFSYPPEIIIPFILLSILATIVFYAFRLILKNVFAAHVAALLLSYGFYSYRFIHDGVVGSALVNIIPAGYRTELTKSIILTLLMAAACGLFAWALNKTVIKYKTLQNLQLYKVLLFAVLFVFAIQVFRVTGRYFEIDNGLSYKYPASVVAKPASANQQSRPDIYYLVFDRYGNAETLKNNFDYDNSDLMNFLSSSGFVNREDAYANYPFTMTSISSTMSMSYFPEFKEKFNKGTNWQSAFPYRSILNNPPVAQILKQNGYQYNQVSSWWDFTRIGIKADSNPTNSFRLNVLGKHFYLSDLSRDILYKSVFSPWLKKGVSMGDSTLIKYELDRSPQENFEAQVGALKNIASREDKSAPAFTFAHFLAPHPPYVFDANGNYPTYNPESNDDGVDEKIKYTNEVTYINKRLKETVSFIQEHSPDAVIVLLADEGPYPKQFRGEMTADNYYDPLKLPPPELKQKFGMLASYYMPGVEPSEVQQIGSSVNTFGFILNNYLGYSLPKLPDCYMAMGNKYSIYNYQLVNDRLTNSDAPAACKDYE